MARASLTTAALVLVASTVATRADNEEEGDGPPPTFSMGPRLGGPAPAPPAPAFLSSSRIAALADGAIAIDEDSGQLLRANRRGELAGEVAIGEHPGLLAYDPTLQLAYVADRGRDRITVVHVGEHLEVRAAWPTPPEPYGVALSPDGKTVLVTAIAGRTLAAIDRETGATRWRTALDSEPRGIAIAPDGARAIVTYLAIGGADEVDLQTPAHAAHRRAYEFGALGRAAYASTFVGPRQVAIALQRSISQPTADSEMGENEGHYGGSFSPPVTEVVQFLETGDRGRRTAAITDAQQPRAIAWDGAHDALYFAGLGNDEVVQVTRASQIDADTGWSQTIASTGRGAESVAARCGADGIAPAPDGSVYVWCAFSRSVVRLDVLTKAGALAAHPTIARGTSLVASTFAPERHEGMVLFHTASDDISQQGALACATCHLDGRSDGLSWRIHGADLQTPMLCGRLAGTAPYKWDGGAKDLPGSVRATVERLGGSGLSKRHVAALVSYLEQMPPARTPPVADLAAVARGHELFESAQLGCNSCHDGPAYTDQARHELAGAKKMDTPSLVGVALSAPYFHDGSAATLEVVLRERGTVHGMADASRALSDREVADLVAYLDTL